jgi:hypothetical protein
MIFDIIKYIAELGCTPAMDTVPATETILIKPILHHV